MTAPPLRSPLEPDADEMRRLLGEVAERVITHIATLPEQPASDRTNADALARSLVERLPERGGDLGGLLDLLFDELANHSYNCPGPGFLAYIPGGGLFEAALADLIADSLNRYVTVWRAAPGLVQLEANVIRWFCEIVGLPDGAGGILTSGGSLANFTALAAARRDRLSEDFLDGVLYCSDQVHHSVVKAAALAGFPAASVRRLPTDDAFRLRAGPLREAIAGDRAAGRRPFLVIASAGTTNTGAVDDLPGLAEVAAGEDLWLHVDAAYGGFFALTARGRQRLAGLEAADSITLDPHKGLFLPYGTGCLLVRDVETLHRAHGLRGEYMPPPSASAERLDFCDISPELSRDFRGLRVWLPLKLRGAEAFRRQLDEKLDLAAWAATAVAAVPQIEMVAEPQLSLLAFRWRPPGVEGAEVDALNRELLDRINDRQRVFMTGTVLDRGFVLRICVLSFRTHRDRLEMAIEDLRAALAEMAAAMRLS